MKTSPKRFENLPLRKKYAKAFGGSCEIGGLFPEESLGSLNSMKYFGSREIVTHHIIHPFQQRRDLVSNIICINPKIHTWGHGKFPTEMTILCLFRKWEKSDGNEKEFDIEELHDCLGSCPIAWLDRNKSRYEEGSEYFKMCLEIIESYEAV